MRYLLEEPFLRKASGDARQTPRYAADLRRELSHRNVIFAGQNNFVHELSLSAVPAVLYREDEAGRHGNFFPASYSRIKKNPAWGKRLQKVHTSARKILLSRDRGHCELDSSNSSDALLMSVFCHAPTTQPGGRLRAMLGIDMDAEPVFGYRPRIPLKTGRFDSTEIDLKFGHLLIEAKLTEYDFQTAPWRLVDRYRDLEEVFDIDELPRTDATLLSYQLVRGVLAAHAEAGTRFCVLCDARRPDLIASWYRILQCVRYPELRCRLALVTWQEIQAACTSPLQRWLEAKYGIRSLCPPATHWS